MFFPFQILVLSYELFISLAFFSHFPDNRESHQILPRLSDEAVIFCLQTLLDVFTSCEHPPWTLLGMSYFRKHRMGILNTRQGEVCMVAPPLLDVQSSFYFLLDSHWILQDIMIFRSWPIPHKLCIVNHQGWSSLLYLFKLQRWFFFFHISMSVVPGSLHYNIFSLESHRILDHFRWSSLLHWFKLKHWFFFISMSLVPGCSD